MSMQGLPGKKLHRRKLRIGVSRLKTISNQFSVSHVLHIRRVVILGNEANDCSGKRHAVVRRIEILQTLRELKCFANCNSMQKTKYV